MQNVSKLALIFMGGGIVLGGLDIYFTLQKIDDIESKFGEEQAIKIQGRMQGLTEKGEMTGKQMMQISEQFRKEQEDFEKKRPRFWNYPISIIGIVLALISIGIGIYVQIQMKPPPKKVGTKVQRKPGGTRIRQS